MKIGVSDREDTRCFLVWRCKENTCRYLSIRATKDWDMKDLQSVCPKCGKKTRLRWHNSEQFCTKQDALERLAHLTEMSKPFGESGIHG